MLPKLKVLFLCTGNSCRSQMCEGWVRRLHGDAIEPWSAGTRPATLDPRAVAVMAEVGVDIASQRAKPVGDLLGIPFDLVVTVCDEAYETCPVVPGRFEVRHRSFDDPPRLASTAESPAEVLGHYRLVRDQIRAFVDELARELSGEPERGSKTEKETSP